MPESQDAIPDQVWSALGADKPVDGPDSVEPASG